MSARLQVIALLVERMQSINLTALEDRDEDDAISVGDLPCVLIQQIGPVEISRIEYMAGGTATHEGSFLLSFAAKLRADAEANMVRALKVLGEDCTLGGKIMNIMPASYGDEGDDGRDYAAIMLELRIMFCTDPYDFGTLIY